MFLKTAVDKTVNNLPTTLSNVNPKALKRHNGSAGLPKTKDGYGFFKFFMGLVAVLPNGKIDMPENRIFY